MAQIETTTASAPAYWASYLVNGDSAGMDYTDETERAKVDAWAASLAAEGWRVVGVEEGSERFARTHNAWGFSPLSGAVCAYILHRCR